MDVAQATKRLRDLLDAHGGSLRAADVEADDELSQDPATASAAAHALATESDIITGIETDGPDRTWFPYSIMMRS